MALVRSLKLVLLAAAALYIAVSGLGPALAGMMPMADGHTSAMGINEHRMCLMPVEEHLLAWQDAFRATVQRSDTLPRIVQLVMIPVLGSAILQQVTLAQSRLGMPNGPPRIPRYFHFW